MKVVTLKIEARTPGGTADARRTRRAGKLPAVVYGEEKEPASVSLDMHEFVLALDHGARVIDLDGGDGAERVLLRDVQYDPLGRNVLHADFLRVNPDKDLTLRVPLELNGVPAGISQGGILSVQARTLEVSCLPRNIPVGVEIDVSALALGASIHAREVALPENVTLAEAPDTILVTVLVPRGVSEDDGDEGEEGDEDADASDGKPAA